MFIVCWTNLCFIEWGNNKSWFLNSNFLIYICMSTSYKSFSCLLNINTIFWFFRLLLLQRLNFSINDSLILATRWLMNMMLYRLWHIIIILAVYVQCSKWSCLLWSFTWTIKDVQSSEKAFKHFGMHCNALHRLKVIFVVDRSIFEQSWPEFSDKLDVLICKSEWFVSNFIHLIQLLTMFWFVCCLLPYSRANWLCRYMLPAFVNSGVFLVEGFYIISTIV